MEKDFSKKMISPREAALLFSISPGTLGNWRTARKGVSNAIFGVLHSLCRAFAAVHIHKAFIERQTLRQRPESDGFVAAPGGKHFPAGADGHRADP